jgi:hypothetical protein
MMHGQDNHSSLVPVKPEHRKSASGNSLEIPSSSSCKIHSAIEILVLDVGVDEWDWIGVEGQCSNSCKMDLQQGHEFLSKGSCNVCKRQRRCQGLCKGRGFVRNFIDKKRPFPSLIPDTGS